MRLEIRYRAVLASAVLIVLLGCGERPASAQPIWTEFEVSFAVSEMDPTLAFEEDQVIRRYAHWFKVEGPGRATQFVRRAVTVLTEDGRDAGRLVLPYDGFRRITSLTGKILDAEGEVVRELSEADLRDYSAISGISLYEDSRVRVAELYYNDYPYTVEYSYQIEHEGVINWPFWFPQQEGAALEYAHFEIDVPEGMPVRHKIQGDLPHPIVSEGQGRQRYRWTVQGRPALEPEPFAPPRQELLDAVYTAPSSFEIDGWEGAMDSWSAFGRWYHALGEGRQALPSAAREQVQQLTAGAETTRERARRLYRYLQASTRYVSVQLGVGRWQPFEAAYVHERRYGDCKALTNYLLALLQEAGIEAHPALIRSGRRAPSIVEDFPSNQFNHVVLAVPVEDEVVSDTLWLEATSSWMPFGRIGAANEGRHALLVDEEGGTLVRTPQSSAETNTQERRVRVALADDGGAEIAAATTYRGNQLAGVRHALGGQSPRQQREWLRSTIDLPGYDLDRMEFADLETPSDSLVLTAELRVPRYASRTGQRLFLRPNLMERWTRTLDEREEPRRYPVHLLAYPFVDTDVVEYALPDGFEVEAAPEPVVVEGPGGRYEASVETEAGTIIYRRRLEVQQVSWAPEAYDELRAFLQRVARADREQVVLVEMQ